MPRLERDAKGRATGPQKGGRGRKAPPKWREGSASGCPEPPEFAPRAASRAVGHQPPAGGRSPPYPDGPAGTPARRGVAGFSGPGLGAVASRRQQARVRRRTRNNAAPDARLWLQPAAAAGRPRRQARAAAASHRNRRRQRPPPAALDGAWRPERRPRRPPLAAAPILFARPRPHLLCEPIHGPADVGHAARLGGVLAPLERQRPLAASRARPCCRARRRVRRRSMYAPIQARSPQSLSVLSWLGRCAQGQRRQCRLF